MNEPSESATSISRVATLLVDLGSDSAVARNRAYQELVALLGIARRQIRISRPYFPVRRYLRKCFI
jgi:hypothetical protein